MVTSVGLNAHRPRQAIVPEAVAPAPRPASGPRRRSALDSGPQVDVRRMGEAPDETTRPSGRIRFPKR